jgi:hypothetical protein
MPYEMSPTADLRFLALGIERPDGHEARANPDLQPTVVLRGTTAKGTMRRMELTEEELLQLMAQATKAIAGLRGIRIL